MIADPTAFSMALLMKFALGYFAILATPGPNMFTIGTMAALRGFRAALPFCLGIALGAGVVAATTSMLLDAFAGSEKLEMGGRVVARGEIASDAAAMVRTIPASIWYWSGTRHRTVRRVPRSR